MRLPGPVPFRAPMHVRLAGPLRLCAGPWAPALLAAVCGALVAGFGWHGADLPTQVYRAALFRRYGFLTFDTSWYGGHYLVTYSVLVPALTAAFGLRLVGVTGAVAAAAGFERLVRASSTTIAVLPSALIFAVGTAVPLLVGEITFLTGFALGLWALVASSSRRPVLTTTLALTCTLASPLAGLFLVLALVAWSVSQPAGRVHRAVAGAVAASPLAVSALAFPQASAYGFAPVQLASLIAFSAAGWRFAPRQMGALRVGMVLYAATGIVLFAVTNPVGGNLIRVGAYLGPALVVAGCWPDKKRLAVLLILPATIWQWSGGVWAMADARNDPTRSASYFQPLVTQIGRLPAPSRIEVPFTRQHWEAAYVAPHLPLARGWERQVDRAENPIFYRRHALTRASYRAWLDDNGVSWVAVPDAALDSAGQAEEALIDTGLNYLHPVWHDAHWSLFHVVGSPGLTTGGGRLSSVAPSRFTLSGSTTGTTLVRIHYTHTWTVTSGSACVSRSAHGWTNVRLLVPGQVTITSEPFARYPDCGLSPP